MPNKIERLSVVTGTITATNAAPSATTPRINFGSAAGGVFIVDSLTTSPTTLTWHVAFGDELTPRPVNDGSAAVTTSVTANTCYPIPDAVFGAPFISVVTNTGSAALRFCIKG
jgi:hypothetical protein